MENNNQRGWRPQFAFCAAAWLFSSSLAAQSPIGSEFQVNPENVGAQNLPDFQFDERGGLWIAWVDSQSVEFNRIIARSVSPQGELGPVLGLVDTSDIPFTPVYDPLIAPTRGGDLRLFYTRSDENGLDHLYGQRFSSAGAALENPVLISHGPPGSTFRSAAVALPDDGVFLVALGTPCALCTKRRASIYARILAPDGSLASPLLQVPRHTGKTLDSGVRNLAVDGQGNAVVVWGGTDDLESRDGSDVHGQRLSASGQRIGKQFLVNTMTRGTQVGPSVAADAEGDFVVVWQNRFPGSLLRSIFGQRFSRTGEKVGPEFRVNEERVEKDFVPMVAIDRFGNFVVTWQNFSPSPLRPQCGHIRARLFRRDGRPVGPEFPVAPEFAACGEAAKVAFSPAGVFAIVWQVELGFSPDTGTDFDVFAARFSASPGDEPCIVRNGRLACDTGRTGGEAELEISLGGRPGETTLAGDFDGDGRADVCAYFAGRFRCDLDHRGAPAEAIVRFGQAGDAPLIGDIDGNGKADPCVRRGDQLLCDTAHDGGAAEVSLRFGTAEEVSLLGDVDGDGRDDLCLRRAGELRCDTAHDGGAPEMTITFGRLGDLPAFGDLDGDGRDDLCVLRSSHLLCDTAHDGGAAELDLALSFADLAGDRPLIANLDGL